MKQPRSYSSYTNVYNLILHSTSFTLDTATHSLTHSLTHSHIHSPFRPHSGYKHEIIYLFIVNCFNYLFEGQWTAGNKVCVWNLWNIKVNCQTMSELLMRIQGNTSVMDFFVHKENIVCISAFPFQASYVCLIEIVKCCYAFIIIIIIIIERDREIER